MEWFAEWPQQKLICPVKKKMVIFKEYLFVFDSFFYVFAFIQTANICMHRKTGALRGLPLFLRDYGAEKILITCLISICFVLLNVRINFCLTGHCRWLHKGCEDGHPDCGRKRCRGLDFHTIHCRLCHHTRGDGGNAHHWFASMLSIFSTLKSWIVRWFRKFSWHSVMTARQEFSLSKIYSCG